MLVGIANQDLRIYLIPREYVKKSRRAAHSSPRLSKEGIMYRDMRRAWRVKDMQSQESNDKIRDEES